MGLKAIEVPKIEFLKSKKHFLKKGNIFINKGETGYEISLNDAIYQLSEIITTHGVGKITLPVLYNDNWQEFLKKLEIFFKED
ncbi:MAG: hypothetical protein ACRC6U_09350 [Fusobacteriaceae bacterium]